MVPTQSCSQCAQPFRGGCTRCRRPLCAAHLTNKQLCQSCAESTLRKLEVVGLMGLWGISLTGGFAAAISGWGALILPITFGPVLAAGLYRHQYRKSCQKRGYLPEKTVMKTLASPLGQLAEPGILDRPNDGSS